MLALVAGKCAAKQGSDIFERFHQAVFDAFFGECRDISNRDVLIELAAGVGLDVARFSQNLDDTWGEAAVLADLTEAQRDFEGWGIPLVVIGEGFPLVGAVPVEIYRRAVDRCLVPGSG